MAIPTLSALRSRFGGARITLLAKAPVADLFEQHPDIDRIIVYQDRGIHRGLRGRLRLVRSLRDERFDLAFLLQNAFEAALLAALAGIPERVGYARDGRGFLLTRSLDKKGAPFHQREAYLHLTRLVGGAAVTGRPYLVLSVQEREEGLAYLKSQGVTIADRLIGINPGAAYGSSKRWIPARFAAVADRLAERYRAKVLIFGGPAEASLAEELQETMKHPSILLAGKTTIRQMMALISRCRLFVTNDSGPMHVASALGVPLVAVFGPTDPAATGPAGQDNIIVRNQVECAPCTHRECPIDHRCMEGVSADEVLGAAEKQLSEKRFAAVFLDRDGTINEDVGYMDSLDKFSLIPGAAAAIARLNRRGVRVFLVTNQSGIARGVFTEAFLHSVHAELQTLLKKEGAFLDGIFYCPHHPSVSPCTCRKPEMGMIERAVLEHRIDLSVSYVVGDKGLDMALAQGGAKGILVRTGHGEATLQEMRSTGIGPDYVADDLTKAVDWILEEMNKRGSADASSK